MQMNLAIEDRLGKQFTFNSLSDLKQFLSSEMDYWSDKSKGLEGKSRLPFAKVSAQIESFLSQANKVQSQLPSDASDQIKQQVQQSIRQLFNPLAEFMRAKWVYRGHPFSEALVSAYQHSQATGDAFVEAIVLKRVVQGTPLSMEAFSGVLMAYEFLFQDESHLLKRRLAEKKAFSTLRNELEGERDRLVSGVELQKSAIADWSGEAKVDFENWFSSFKDQSGNFLQSLQGKSANAISDHSAFFNKMAETAVGRVQELEDLYREKLRLEAPAKYWSDRAQSLGKQGGLFATLLMLVSLVAAIGAGTFFYSWLHKAAVPLSLATLQGVALFGATAAAVAYLLRVLSKLTFSAFHLQRDAEEREQLAHLYLALMDKGALDASSREIVLQALFSRAESGLLGGDSGPTMPSPADIVTGLSKVKV